MTEETTFIESVKASRDSASKDKKAVLDYFKKDIAEQAKHGSNELWFDLAQCYGKILDATEFRDLTFQQFNNFLHRTMLDLEYEGFKVEAKFGGGVRSLYIIVKW